MTKNHDPHISAKRVCSYSLRSRQPNLHRALIFLISIFKFDIIIFGFWLLYIFHELLPYWFWSPKTTIHTFRLNESGLTRWDLDNQTFTARLSFCFQFVIWHYHFSVFDNYIYFMKYYHTDFDHQKPRSIHFG